MDDVHGPFDPEDLEQSPLDIRGAETSVPGRAGFGPAAHQGSGDINQAGRDVIVYQQSIPSLPVPRQLPPDVRCFTGRDIDMGMLGAVLPRDDENIPGPVVISAIAGTAGVGKTALAVHWAHRVRDRFPDGQLYIDLRGYARDPRVDPAEALRMFLTALDVPPDKIPPGLEERAALYRSKLDGRRLLIVLDNAATPEQVRPLVPNSATCLVVVTSRSELAGLVALDGARRITLGLLSPDEAVTLLRKIIGAERVDAEPNAANALARVCACLPLALRIAAERVVARPHITLVDLVDELAEEHNRLNVLVTDDPAAAVRVVFSWSYHALFPESARMFRFLGLHAGPNISTRAAAALANVAPDHARRLLHDLTRVHLLQETGKDRYQFHDLLRVYAAERATDEETSHERMSALQRVWAWYLHTADAAARVFSSQRLLRVSLDPSDVTCPPLAFTSQEQAVEWCEAELPNLTAATYQAAEHNQHTTAWRIPAVLWDFFSLRLYWSDWINTHEIGLASARQIHDRYGEAWILNNLGNVYCLLQQSEEAIGYLQHALVIRREIGDRNGEGWTLYNLGDAYRGLQRFEEAIDSLQQALTISREAGEPWGEGWTLYKLGEAYRGLQRFEEAVDSLQQSLTISRQIDNRLGEAWALNMLGEAYRGLQRFEEAIDSLQQALTISRRISDQMGEVRTLNMLGKVFQDTDRLDAARECWHQALAIVENVMDSQAAKIRARLEALDSQ